MRTLFLILVVVFFSVRMPGPGLCAEVTVGPAKADTAKADDIADDFSSLRDPFFNQLPRPEKVKTPVEPVVQKVDNTKKPVEIEPVKKEPVKKVEPVKVVVTPQKTVTQPKPKPKPTIPTIKLQGIIWGTDQPQAIIGDKVVGIGGIVQGAKLESIQRDGADFTIEGEKFHVSMD